MNAPKKRRARSLAGHVRKYAPTLNPYLNIDTTRPPPIQFIPLADPLDAHRADAYGEGLTAESPEQDG